MQMAKVGASLAAWAANDFQADSGGHPVGQGQPSGAEPIARTVALQEALLHQAADDGYGRVPALVDTCYRPCLGGIHASRPAQAEPPGLPQACGGLEALAPGRRALARVRAGGPATKDRFVCPDRLNFQPV